MQKLGLVLVLSLLILSPVIPHGVFARSDDTPGLDDESYAASVDSAVWQQFGLSPHHRARFVVHYDQDVIVVAPPDDGEGALAELLDLMKRTGTIRDYAFDPGAPVIRVDGSARAVRLLSTLPGITRITLAESDAVTSSSLHNLGEDPDPAYTLATGRITGVVTGPGGAASLANIEVTAQRRTESMWVTESMSTTLTDGSYEITGLPVATYRVRFRDPAGTYVREYYNDQRDPPSDLENLVTVYEGQTVPGIDASLALAGFIGGTVTTDIDDSGVPDIVAIAQQYRNGAWRLDGTGSTSEDGSYVIRGLAEGGYVIRFEDPYEFPRYLEEYYNNVLDINAATEVPVTAGSTTGNINAGLGEYGAVTGTVSSVVGGIAASGIDVGVWEYDTSGGYWSPVSWAETDAAGLYRAQGLDTGEYRVEFSDPSGQFVGEFYDNKSSIDAGDPIAVSLGAVTPDIDASLDLASDTVSQDLALGWNLISFPVTLDDPSTLSALETITGTYNVVWAYDGCVSSSDDDAWISYDIDNPLSKLTTVDTSPGYWIDLTEAGTLTVTGTHPISTVISLCTGWNLIGYASVSSKPVTEVLAPIEGKYDLVYGYDGADTQDEWKKYNPSVPVGNDLKELRPWYGYWIHMTAPANLTILGR